VETPKRYTSDVTIVDGRNLLFRSADVNRNMTAEADGEVRSVGGVFGFLTVLLKLKRRYQGNIVVAWEGDTPNFRFGLFPDYKRKKPPTDEELLFFGELDHQEKRLNAILTCLGVRQFAGINCEADDVIGTIATRLEAFEVAIFSSDSDLRQLVTDTTTVLAPGRKGFETFYGPAEVLERHEVEPRKIPCQKALAGDGSDGIPGIPSVGDKFAATWINEYGDVEGVIKAALGGAFTPKKRALIIEHQDKVRLYRRLTEIKTDVELVGYKTSYETMKARRKMHLLKFRRLLDAGTFVDLKRLG
jgi:DNA polymerase-1